MAHELNDDNATAHRSSTNLSLANGSLAIAQEKDMSLRLVLTLQVLIALFGVAGNVVVVTVISRMSKKKKPSDLYLQNLAIGDIGTLLLAFPSTTIKTWFGWPFGEFTCRYLYPIPEIFYGASVWFIAVIAIERYRKVVTMKPTMKDKLKNRTLLQRAKTVAACVWVASFSVFCFPMFFVIKYRQPPGWCGPVWPDWDRNLLLNRLYVGSLTLFTYVLPLTVISVTYFLISRKIHESDAFIKSMKKELRDTGKDGPCTPLAKQKSARLSHNKRAKKILTPLVTVFALTMLPLTLFRLIIVFWPAIVAQEYYTKLLYTVTFFVILNSSANPVIYSVVSKEFRKGLNNLCLPRRQMGNSLDFEVFLLRFKSRNRNSGQQLSPS